MQSLFQNRPMMGQPFGGLPASAYIPAAGILPTSSPNMFPFVTMPPAYPLGPQGAPILVETYPGLETAGPSPTTIAVIALAAVAGIAAFAFLK